MKAKDCKQINFGIAVLSALGTALMCPKPLGRTGLCQAPVHFLELLSGKETYAALEIYFFG